MAENRQYDHEYKVQAVKLAKEIGQAKACLLYTSRWTETVDFSGAYRG